MRYVGSTFGSRQSEVWRCIAALEIDHLHTYYTFFLRTLASSARLGLMALSTRYLWLSSILASKLSRSTYMRLRPDFRRVSFAYNGKRMLEVTIKVTCLY